MFGKISLYSVLLLALASSLVLVSHVAYFLMPYTEVSADSPVIDPLVLTTEAWGIFNLEDGAILEGKNIETIKPIASVTKLFTAYAVLESKTPHEPVVITWSDVQTEGRAGKLFYGEQTSLEDLLFPLLIESSNDAGAAIYRTLGNDFVDTIANLKSNLSLTQTTIIDATGLSAQNVSSIKDLARFYSYLGHRYPHITDITQLGVYVGEHTGFINNNPAHALQEFTGGKHGFTDEAGRTFVGTFRLKGEKREIGIVLLGSNNLLPDITAVLAYAEKRF